MALSTRDSKSAQFDLTSASPNEVDLAEPDRATAEILVPHLVAATLILATMTITPPNFWNEITALVTATLGPTLFALSAVTGVCGLISYGAIWWFCERGSRVHHRSILKAARRAERKKRRKHAA